jgi:HEPN domain-containing protein
MIDHSEHWLTMADDSMEDAKWALKGNRVLLLAYSCNLTIEKALKAKFSSVTGEIPPKTHDLVKLAQRGDIYDKFNDDQLKLIEVLMPLQTEARYSEYKEMIKKSLTPESCAKLCSETEELLCFIKKTLEK